MRTMGEFRLFKQSFYMYGKSKQSNRILVGFFVYLRLI